MVKPIIKYSLLVLLIFSMLTLGLTTAAAPSASNSLYCISGFGNATVLNAQGVFYGNSTIRPISADYSNIKLYVGGIPFGVKFMTDGVIVTGFADIKTDSARLCPAADAGLRVNDIILKVNGNTVSDAAALSDMAEASMGQPITVEYSRDGKTYTTTLTPALCKEEGKYKSGMYVKDSGAGIGTVTYIVPDSLSFGGLGHGICDGETGKLVPMQRGSVVGVTISGVVKGLSGSPGEVRGYFSSGKSGTLLKNTECGVFGAFASLPENITGELMSIGTRSTLKSGKAYILCTLDGTTPQKYEVEISDIHVNSSTNKCFTVKVTDEALIEKSGGIVQGMSGSPIIQNGKLVGAVTHVLINDPTTGYGIFIENMLANS